jgi:hypothetical protein
MGVLKFDMTDVEPGKDFDTPIPKGVYRMKILDIEEGESGTDGRPMLTVELEVISGDWKGRRLWDYIKYQDESSAWKYRQLLEAVGKLSKKGKQSGSFDPSKHIGDIVVVKVKHETDAEYGTQAKVGSMTALPEDEVESAAAEAEAPAEEPAAGGDAGGEEEVTAADVRKMDLDELKEFAEEQELEDIKFTKRSNVEKKAGEIIEALELEDEADAVEDPEDWDDLAALDRDQLTAYIGQEELEIDPDELETDDELRAAIAEELEIEVPAEDAGASIDDMSVKELKAACSEQGLETKGGKKAMIKRLKAAAESGSGDPF